MPFPDPRVDVGTTERILANLPRTFRPLPQPSALFSLANAIGSSLQETSNLLVEVMKAHWVDHADRGRSSVRDLDLLGALYDLQSRPDEGVEAFRAHLKLHVQSLLEGTATVRGILRVAADTLGLAINPDALEHPRERRLPREDDATRLLFGVPWIEATGAAAQPAGITGRNDLSSGVDLRSAHVLELEVDGATHTVDLAVTVENLEQTRLSDVVGAINAAFGAPVASHDGRYPRLTSPAVGADARVVLGRPAAPDAADLVFGIPPRFAQGADARPAEVTGTLDLSGGVDLRTDHYLRIVLDGTAIAEVDGGADPATPLSQVVDAINGAIGQTIAVQAGDYLQLRTPSNGLDRSIEIQPAAANDAARLLLGPGAYGYYAGDDARPARFVGRQLLGQGVDLRVERYLVLRIDGGDSVEIDCSGAAPEQSSIHEIVSRINAAVRPDVVASEEGNVITLTSPTIGSASTLEILSAAEGDAAFRILGFPPREAVGRDPEPARIAGQVDLPPTLDLRLHHRITLGSAGQDAVEIDVSGPVAAETTPEQVVTAINTQVGREVASLSDNRLRLTSLDQGMDQWLALIDRAQVVRSPFVTQAPVQDEAAPILFGFVDGRAEATLGQPAQLVGQVDLSSGVDLRTTSYLRITIDDQSPRDIDCGGDRPRVSRPEEIAARVNDALGSEVATVTAGHIVLTSPTTGPASQIVVDQSSAADAAEVLLGLTTAAVSGRDATRVAFTSTQDLTAGLDISDRYLVRVGLDDRAPADIDLRGNLAANSNLPDQRVDLDQIVDILNAALGNGAAVHNGQLLTIRSPLLGPASRLIIEPPGDAEHDATPDLFGISVPRSYAGADATAAELTGAVQLSGPIDLSQRHFLRLALDGEDAQDVDCAGATPSATTLDEVVDAINRVFGPDQASVRDERLVLTSAETGSSSRVVVTPSTAADAGDAILGTVPALATGGAGTPAMLTALVAPPNPVDLSARGVIRVAVDDGPPRDIDVRGASPGLTRLDEVVVAINGAFGSPVERPIASLTPEGLLRLSGDSAVELFALRALTLIEFPPAAVDPVSLSVEHGTTWTLSNNGVSPAALAISLASLHGVVQPTFVSRNVAARLNVDAAVGPGQTVRVWLDADGAPRAEIDGTPAPVEVIPSADVLRLPPGTSDWQFLECLGARFDQDRFDQTRFVPGPCRTPGIFDVSHFAESPDATDVAVFAIAGDGFDSGTTVTFTWEETKPGMFTVELPQDLLERFGARFDAGRFAGDIVSSTDLIIETDPQPGSLIEWINGLSASIEARSVPDLPDGAVALRVPWDRPVALSGGTASTPARLFLTEDGLTDYVEVRAREPGTWGNLAQLTISAGAPAGSYAVTLSYDGAVYENAVETVRAQVLPARAAGIDADVTRAIGAE
jgi:hypothetical protein